MITIYELANGIGAQAGFRNLILIPPLYLTSLVHEFITPMSLAATNILQPIYNPNSFFRDLKKYEPQATVGSKAHYLSLEHEKIGKDSLKFLILPYCGGEALSKPTVSRINGILNIAGAENLIIGYGQTELGTMAMFNYNIFNRTNESGIPLPEVKAKILDIITGKPVEFGNRGELYIQSPAVMKEYLNDPTSTSKFFFIDENGGTWARTGDVVEVIYKYDDSDVYNVAGRKNDSFVDENGNVVYLFDIENQVENVKYVNQAEVIALTVNGKKVPIVHIIIDKKAKKISNEILKLIDLSLKKNFSNANYIPFAYKIRDSFSTSPISGKRDYEILKYETEGYYRINDKGDIEIISIISEESQVNNDLIHSKILVKK